MFSKRQQKVRLKFICTLQMDNFTQLPRVELIFLFSMWFFEVLGIFEQDKAIKICVRLSVFLYNIKSITPLTDVAENSFWCRNNGNF